MAKCNFPVCGHQAVDNPQGYCEEHIEFLYLYRRSKAEDMQLINEVAAMVESTEMTHH